VCDFVVVVQLTARLPDAGETSASEVAAGMF